MYFTKIQKSASVAVHNRRRLRL